MGKILVVDDQRNMRTTLAMMLRGQGYEVDEAADGAQGRDLGAAGAFDVVLTDLRMGEYDGIEVLRGIKEAQPPGKIIVFSSELSTAVDASYRRHRVDHILPKPIFPSDLRAIFATL